MTSMFALWAGALLSFGGPVTEVAITPMGEQTSVLIAVDGAFEHRAFAMEGPHRLVVDLMGTEFALPRAEFNSINRGGIRGVRASQYSADVVRITLDLTEKVGFVVTPHERGLRLTLENPEVGAFEPWSSGTTAMSVVETAASLAPTPIAPQQSQAERISMRWIQEPLQNVLLHFATFSGKSIIPGANITAFVTAEIINQPWDVALETVLSSYGLDAQEDEYGIIRVASYEALQAQETAAPIVVQAHPVNYATAQEIANAIAPLLTLERGAANVNTGTNTVLVSDTERVQGEVARLIQQLDVPTPQVNIRAKIIFVNRTDLDELGVTYELKDSRGNQLNQLSSGAADQDGDGVISLPDEAVEQGTAVVSLGGNSIAALGNAAARVGNPTLQMLTSMVVGRHQLIGFIDALRSVNLSDIEAEPQVTVLNNQQAELLVGELTPIRTIDAGAGAAGAGTFPTAQVTQQETGIILRATPHVTADGTILLELEAERSAAELAESDAGFIFRTQRAQTRVLVADGETVVIAGLTQSERTEARSGIPLLMDLPVIGRLFRVNREQVVQRDLIILVTPHIVRSAN